MNKKSLVLYYTWAGHTAKMAQSIAAITGADLQEVLPQQPYSQNYQTVVDDAKKEIQEGYLPPIQPLDRSPQDYEVIYVGSPIWWGTIAPPLATALTQSDLSGKTIAPFTTHGGGGKGHSDRDIVQFCPNSTVLPMYTAYEGGSESELHQWIKQNNG